MSLCWSRRGKSSPNSPQIPLFHHQSSPSSLGSPGGWQPPRSPRIRTHQHPDTAECSEHPREAPTAPKHLPPSPDPQGPARSVAPSGTPSIPFAPGASPGPSRDPAPSQQGSPVLMGAVGSQLQESAARAGTEGRGQPYHRHPRGVVGHPPPAPPAGRGREGARKSGCGFEPVEGRTSRREQGQRGLGAAGTPGEGGRVWAARHKGASSEGSASPEQLRAGARVAPKAEVTANLVPGLPPPRARCGHGQGGSQGALRYLSTGKRGGGG